MRFRIDKALEKGASRTRRMEWALSLEDLNHDSSEATPLITLYERRKGGLDVVILTPGAPSAVIPLTPDYLAEHFQAYAHVIGRMSSASEGDGARSFETLDYGKKLIHDEAGEAIQEALEDHIDLPLATARRLFTLVFLILSDLPEHLVKQHRTHL